MPEINLEFKKNSMNIQEEFIDIIISNSQDYIYLKDQDSHFIKVNHKTAQALGAKNPNEVIGKSDYDYFPELAEKTQADEKKIIETGIPQINEIIEMTFANGTIHQISMTKIPFHDKDGKIKGIIGISRDLTSEKIGSSEEKLQNLIESSSEFIWQVNKDGIYNFVSDNVCDITGYGPSDILGKTPFDFMHPDEAKRVGSLFTKIVENKEKISRLEDTWTHKNGKNIVFETNGTPLFDNDRRYYGYFGICRDITRKKQVEQSLKHNEERLKKSQRIARLGSWEWDIENNTLWWSDALYWLLGLNKESFQLNFDDISRLIHPDDRKKNKAMVNRLVKDGISESIELRFIKPDGEIIWTHQIIEVIKDEKGKARLCKGIIQDITQQKHTEDKLIKSERKYRTYIDNAPDAVIVLDEKGHFIDVNTAAENISGYLKSELIGKNIMDLIHEDWKKDVREHIQHVLKKGYDSWENAIYLKQGAMKFCSINAVKIDDNTFLGFCKDITESKKLRDEIIENKNFLNEILETTNDGIIVLNKQFHYTYWNKAIEKISEIPRENVVGSKKIAWKMFPHLKKIGIDKLMKRAMNGEIIERHGIPYTLKSGKSGYTSESFIPIYNSNNKIKGIIEIVRETTKEEKSKREMKLLAETANSLVAIEYEAIYDVLEEALNHFTKNCIIAINVIKDQTAQAKKIIGIDSKKQRIANNLLGSHKLTSRFGGMSDEAKEAIFSGRVNKIPGGLYDAFFGTIPKPICTSIERLFGIDALYSIGLRRKNKIYGSLTIATKKDSDISFDAIETLVNQVSSVLERQEAFRKLELLNETLEEKVQMRTQRVQHLLQQKEDFINQLGHDLKTPIGPLLNLLPVLEKSETDEKKIEMIRVMRRNVGYMKDLVIKTIELAKLNSKKTKFQFTRLNLFKIISDIIDSNQLLFNKKNITVKNKVQKNTMIFADQLHIEELLTNLLNNAVKYNIPDGKITIDAQPKKDFLQIYIQDTGQGMTPFQIDHVFDEFYKSDVSRHDFESSGLGLSICKRIIENHSGNIWVESEGLQKGSTVYFTLPLNKNILCNKKIENE